MPETDETLALMIDLIFVAGGVAGSVGGTRLAECLGGAAGRLTLVLPS